MIFLISSPQTFAFGYNRYPAAEKILNFIEINTTGSARIHVQDSRTHPYFGSHFTAFIPYRTSKEILAGPVTFPPTKFRFTQFIDDLLFGKNLDDISSDEFKKYLELYNIKYFLIFSKNAHQFFDKNSRFKKIFNAVQFSIYEYLDAEENYCYRCNAVVKADYDKIVIESATSNITILKYHYIDTLKVKPERLKIKPIKLLDDPVPFIMVENGDYSSFTIYNK
jgi:hypothetical protein